MSTGHGVIRAVCCIAAGVGAISGGHAADGNPVNACRGPDIRGDLGPDNSGGLCGLEQVQLLPVGGKPGTEMGWNVSHTAIQVLTVLGMPAPL